MRVHRENLRVEIENEMRVFLESLNFEIRMRVSQKSARWSLKAILVGYEAGLGISTLTVAISLHKSRN